MREERDGRRLHALILRCNELNVEKKRQRPSLSLGVSRVSILHKVWKTQLPRLQGRRGTLKRILDTKNEEKHTNTNTHHRKKNTPYPLVIHSRTFFFPFLSQHQKNHITTILMVCKKMEMKNTSNTIKNKILSSMSSYRTDSPIFCVVNIPNTHQNQ